jgi:hypothetical protein
MTDPVVKAKIAFEFARRDRISTRSIVVGKRSPPKSSLYIDNSSYTGRSELQINDIVDHTSQIRYREIHPLNSLTEDRSPVAPQ